MKNATTLAAVQDETMEELVTQVEKHFIQRADRVQLVDLIDANTRGVLVLFPYVPRNIEPGKIYPVMTGHLDTRRVKIPVSAFAKNTEECREFLSLSIGPAGQNHLGGAMFRQEEQNKETGLWALAPGKENERLGVIAKTIPVVGTEEFETVFQLRFYGKRRISNAGVHYIKAQIYPERKAGAVDQAGNECF